MKCWFLNLRNSGPKNQSSCTVLHHISSGTATYTLRRQQARLFSQPQGPVLTYKSSASDVAQAFPSPCKQNTIHLCPHGKEKCKSLPPFRIWHFLIECIGIILICLRGEHYFLKELISHLNTKYSWEVSNFASTKQALSKELQTSLPLSP